MSSPAAHNDGRIAGSATAQGTLRYAARFQGRSAPGHFREIPGGQVLSSIGIGTYLGEPDPRTDNGYAQAVVAAVEGGINVIDSAINYRFQRSERSIGKALREVTAKGYGRDELVLCTKAGFLTPDGEMPPDPNEYFAREFLDRGVFQPEEIAAGCHCMAPKYLADQMERSLRNFGVEAIDVFYLHNPESQLADISREAFLQRLRDAFAMLEKQIKAGSLRYYGMATWSAFRLPEGSRDYISLAEVAELAREQAGDEHHFRFIQLPFSLAMPEAYALVNQAAANQGSHRQKQSLLATAAHLGMAVVGSATLQQGQLTQGLPGFVGSILGLNSDAENAIQFSRSAPGMTTSLVGMGHKERVAANLKPALVAPTPIEEWNKLFTQR